MVYLTSCGSIPACAGEPYLPAGWQLRQGVYPRVCGGTISVTGKHQQLQGLSPRVRGNQNGSNHDDAGFGSIPACAGEPDTIQFEIGHVRVYPRVCGGTGAVFVSHHQLPGSIPACAGEPCQRLSCRSPCGVYPRVCGGTDPGLILSVSLVGLSPRVRGNPMTCR